MSIADARRFHFRRRLIGEVQKYELYYTESSVRIRASFSDFFVALAAPSNTGSEELYKQFHGILSSSDSPNAYFFECPPITFNDLLTTPFEFVLVPALPLQSKSYDAHSFESHFKQGDIVTSFSNLGGDSTLVVPCPPDDYIVRPSSYQGNLQIFTHLAAFSRGASMDRFVKLFERVSNTYLDVLSHNHNSNNVKRWLSTSGLGVYWLHVRIDTRPKYYQWTEYKNA